MFCGPSLLILLGSQAREVIGDLEEQEAAFGCFHSLSPLSRGQLETRERGLGRRGLTPPPLVRHPSLQGSRPPTRKPNVPFTQRGRLGLSTPSTTGSRLSQVVGVASLFPSGVPYLL
jgi:hypothetical protein